MGSRVTVVIVNWNGRQFLEQCLSSLMSQTVPAHEVIVVDNASSDDSLEIIRRFPSVRLLAQSENLGFARANNLAIQLAAEDSDLIALLNPDAFPEPDWLESLISAARDFPDYGSFGSRQLMHDRPDVLDGTGDVYHISGVVWRNGHGHPQSAADLVPREIFSPCACAALYRRDALDKVGGFDEDYFCYIEDVDLGFRLRLAGYPARYVPNALVHHVGSGTSGGQHSDFALYHGHRNVVWTFVKDMPGLLFWLLLPLHIAANCLTIFYYSLSGRGRVMLRAKLDAMKGIPNMWRKRREAQARRRVSPSDIWRLMSKGLRRSRA